MHELLEFNATLFLFKCDKQLASFVVQRRHAIASWIKSVRNSKFYSSHEASVSRTRDYSFVRSTPYLLFLFARVQGLGHAILNS